MGAAVGNNHLKQCFLALRRSPAFLLYASFIFFLLIIKMCCTVSLHSLDGRQQEKQVS